MATIKCVILGAPKTGKTSFYLRHKTGEFHSEPPVVSEPRSLSFQTNLGNVRFEIWENEAPGPVDCALLFFSTTDRESYFQAEKIYDSSIAGKIPHTVLCRNKVDVKHPEICASEIDLHRRLGMSLCEISCKSNFNYCKPFLCVARSVLACPLKITGLPAFD